MTKIINPLYYKKMSEISDILFGVVYARIELDLSLSEISELFQIPYSTANSRFNRGHRIILDKLVE